MRAFLAFLFGLLAPAVALAQDYPGERGAGVLSTFWWCIMVAVGIIAVWAFVRAQRVRGPPYTRP